LEDEIVLFSVGERLSVLRCWTPFSVCDDDFFLFFPRLVLIY